MPKLSKFSALTKTVTVTLDGAEDEPLTVRYRTLAYTAATERAIREAEKDGRVSEAHVVFLKPLIAEWDLTDEKGKALPLDDAHLSDVPIAILAAIIAAIGKDARPN